jgi:hypothetical protein
MRQNNTFANIFTGSSNYAFHAPPNFVMRNNPSGPSKRARDTVTAIITPKMSIITVDDSEYENQLQAIINKR